LSADRALRRTPRPRTPRRSGGALAVLLVAASLGWPLGGCLWEPKIEDQWTRVDLTTSNLVPLQAVPSGSTLAISGHANITYRSILTGAVVAELRASTSISSIGSIVRPDAEREPMAAAIDQLLASSVSLGRDAKEVTGWDHLIQPFDFSFSGTVPAVLDSAGVPTGAPVGLFLVCYLGSATKLELPGGGDSLIVVPFVSSQYRVLPVGLPLTVTGPRPN
jgi:hypothetical protein